MRTRIQTIHNGAKQAILACASEVIYSIQFAAETIGNGSASLWLHSGLSGWAFGGLDGAKPAHVVRINEYETRRLSGGQIPQIRPLHPVGHLGPVGVAK